jgi:hypothetical protein
VSPEQGGHKRSSAHTVYVRGRLPYALAREGEQGAHLKICSPDDVRVVDPDLAVKPPGAQNCRARRLFVPARIHDVRGRREPSISTSSWFSVFSRSSLPPAKLHHRVPDRSDLVDEDDGRGVLRGPPREEVHYQTTLTSPHENRTRDGEGTPASPAVALAAASACTTRLCCQH